MNGITPNWPAPTWVRAFTTTRNLNLAYVRNDQQPHDVEQNRRILSQQFNYMYEPIWLNQTHSTNIVEIKKVNQTVDEQADGAWTQLTGIPCAVLTADCLPLLLCDTKGTVVAAVHCGWRGLAKGIIENTVKQISLNAEGEILAWLGPAIGQSKFEVGSEVREEFLKHDLRASIAFQPTANEGKWLADIYELATQRLHESGVRAIFGGDLCTYTDTERFYSYRRDKDTGRMATLIWLTLP